MISRFEIVNFISVFHCEAYAELADTHGVLITSTKSPYNEVSYSCWVSVTFIFKQSCKKMAYLICNLVKSIESAVLSSLKLNLS